MHVWTVVFGKIASIASGNPLRPSTHAIRMSWTPRVFRSVRTCIQNFAPSVSWNHIPSTSRSPSRVTPEREVQRAALHRSALADLQHHAVEEHDRVDVLQRPLGPLAHVVHHPVGHAADQVAPDLHAVDLLEVRLDIARGEPTRSRARGSSRRTRRTAAGASGRSSAQSCRLDRGERRSRPSRAR